MELRTWANYMAGLLSMRGRRKNAPTFRFAPRCRRRRRRRRRSRSRHCKGKA